MIFSIRRALPQPWSRKSGKRKADKELLIGGTGPVDLKYLAQSASLLETVICHAVFSPRSQLHLSPVYAISDTYLGEGTVGGYTVRLAKGR